MTSIHKNIDDRTIEIFYDNPRFIHEVIDNNEYNEVFKDLVVMDLGANIGSFSYWIYDRAKVIYAIEPEPRCVELMNKTKYEGKLDKLNIFELAIAAQTGDRLFIFDPDKTGGGGYLDPYPVKSPKHMIVPTKSISDFIESEAIDHVDILKIDVEGGEREIFQSRSFKSVAEKIKTIVGEYHQYDPTEDLEACGYIVSINKTSGKFLARRK